ncbi:class I mannose-6-phosphate isomerase [Mycoplasma todarodis]|uniref:class I mannose-6-phosphate isomerase n=1 Tax=Mycoplasma todarodis TaxID=1937191 RepID=UPI003B379505
MKKIQPLHLNKIWGYEKWLHSPIPGRQTQVEDGTLVTNGPLIKIIKADKPLSIQVHPDDYLAKKLENEENGKAECWYVLEATPKSEFIVGITTQDEKEIKAALKEKRFFKLLKTHTPSVGEFINVPAGLVHGVGQDSKVLEVQQPSDTTYRFYDYDRLENGQPRELHVDKSIMSTKDLEWKLKSSEKLYEKYNIDKYSISLFEKDHKNFQINTKSILVDLTAEEAYYVEPGDEAQITFEKFALIEF